MHLKNGLTNPSNVFHIKKWKLLEIHIHMCIESMPHNCVYITILYTEFAINLICSDAMHGINGVWYCVSVPKFDIINSHNNL